MSELTELQSRVTAIRAERGFVTDLVKLLVLMTEEVGELARGLKGTWSANYPAPDSARLAEELADITVLAVAMAWELGVDLGTAIERKFIVGDAERDWASASPRDL